jgi:hypothetical protein
VARRLLTDAAGNATLPSVDQGRTGYSSASAALGAVPISAPFTTRRLLPATVAGVRLGLVTLLDNGFAGGTPRMSYQDNVFGVFNGAWTLKCRDVSRHGATRRERTGSFGLPPRNCRPL